MIQNYTSGTVNNLKMKYLEKEINLEHQNRMREQIILAIILIFAVSGLVYSLYQPEFISDLGTGQMPFASSYFQQ